MMYDSDMDRKIFSSREHLEALVTATQKVFDSTENPSDRVISGVFQACLERMDVLYKQVEQYKENQKNLCRLVEELRKEVDDKATKHLKRSFKNGNSYS